MGVKDEPTEEIHKKEGDEKLDKKEKKDKKEEKSPKSKTQATTSALSRTVSAELDQRKLFKEGQRFITPPMADPTRAFYESLLEENPESKIAIRFCIENGVLPADKHKLLLKKYNHLKDKGAFSVQAQLK